MTTSQHAAPSTGAGRVRAGDDDRARATAMLSEHYVQGRLDETELDQRTSRALSAVYLDELDALFTDLPGVASIPPASMPNRRADSLRTRRRSWVPALLVAAVVLVVLTRGAALWVVLGAWWFAGAHGCGHRRSGGRVERAQLHAGPP